MHAHPAITLAGQHRFQSCACPGDRLVSKIKVVMKPGLASDKRVDPPPPYEMTLDTSIVNGPDQLHRRPGAHVPHAMRASPVALHNLELQNASESRHLNALIDVRRHPNNKGEAHANASRAGRGLPTKPRSCPLRLRLVGLKVLVARVAKVQGSRIDVL